MKKFLLLALLALSACKTPITPPLAAIAVSCAQDNNATVIYVVVDPTHLIRFSPHDTTIRTYKDGKESEEHLPPTPFESAYKLASQAAIKDHVVVPCDTSVAT